DLSRLEELVASAEDLWPAEPRKIEAMKSWLAHATELAGRLEGHTRALERIRRSGTPVAPESRAGASRAADSRPAWKVEPTSDQFKHDTTARLVAELGTFVDPDPHRGTLTSVRKRLAFAESVEHETVGRYAAEWKEAIRSIADVAECPKYAGLRVAPQIGLVPIGKDP